MPEISLMPPREVRLFSPHIVFSSINQDSLHLDCLRIRISLSDSELEKENVVTQRGMFDVLFYFG